MSSAKKLRNTVPEEISKNFLVVYSTIRDLHGQLGQNDFLTSYVFISENIQRAVSFIKDGLDAVSKKSKSFEDTIIDSPLMISTYANNPIMIYEYRSSVREFSDKVRTMVDRLYSSVARTLAAYILVYETLEKFGLKTPFLLVESNEFSSQPLKEFIFGEFDVLGQKIELGPNNTEIITYSNIDIDDPLSLLIIGHEVFHIINRTSGAFRDFCKATGFRYERRYEEAFVDIMSNLYYGGAYTYAMQRHFERIYPLSGESHPEMTVRLLILSFLQTKLGNSRRVSGKTLNDFVQVLSERMSEEARRNEQNDREQLDNMISNGVIEFIKHLFERKGVVLYDSFVRDVETKELQSSHEALSRNRIRYMIANKIPAAVRPVTLFNSLTEETYDNIDSHLVIQSFKKWYVKRYYEKNLERATRAKDSATATSTSVK